MNLFKKKIILLFLLNENGIFYIQSGREESKPPKFVRNVLAECVHFLF